MWKYMERGFRELGRSLGATFEHYSAAFLEVMLEELGHPEAKVERRFFVHGEEVVKVNLFCEDPPVIGEMTMLTESAEEAEREIGKRFVRSGFFWPAYGCCGNSDCQLDYSGHIGVYPGSLKALSTKCYISFCLGFEWCVVYEGYGCGCEE